MSIALSQPVRELNARLSNMEACAENAPEGTYEKTKEVANLVGEISANLFDGLRGIGLSGGNDDRLRVVEAVVYGYVLQSNPDLVELLAAEGFGEAMHGPGRDRVIADAMRDRDALRSLPGGPGM